MTAQRFLELPGGLKMPTIGLGTWQSQDEVELTTALNYALDCGYRHIDTAYFYQNEKVIGKVLKEWLDLGKVTRDELFVTTKLPIPGIHPDRVEHFMKLSLEDLQLEYVDLYLIHFPVGVKKMNGLDVVPEPVNDHVGIWKKMEEQVDAGRTKTIGLSNFNIKQIKKILQCARIKPANHQVEIHVYMQQENLVAFCQKNDITVVAYSPLGSPGYNKFLTAMNLETVQLPNMLEDETITELAAKHGKTNAQIMIRFLLERNIAVIPKSVKESRIKENIDVFDFSLDDDDMNKLRKLEIGEAARVVDWKLFTGFGEHPDYPFK